MKVPRGRARRWCPCGFLAREGNVLTARRILIIGGGVTGLAAAVRIVQQAKQTSAPMPHVQVWNATDQWGGMLQTRELPDGLVECCADMFTTKLPWAWQLCETIGFCDELIPTDERRRGALVATANGTRPVPPGFSLLVPQRWDALWRSPLLSLRAKFRMRLEPWIAMANRRFYPDRGEDESFRDFTIRHWGQEAFERLIQPLVSGIFTADPARLSMTAALPEFVEMERAYGSLIRAQRANTRAAVDGAHAKPQGASSSQLQDVLTASSPASHEAPAAGVRYGLFLTPRHGMQSWMDAIQRWLVQHGVELVANRTAVRVRGEGNQWVVDGHGSGHASPIVAAGGETPMAFDGVIVATPAWQASALLNEAAGAAANELAKIEYASAAIVVSRYSRDHFEAQGHGLGFGMVVPHYLGSPLIATSFASQKFPGRCRPSDLITRSFFGGALHPDHVDWDDTRLIQAAHDELKRFIPVAQSPLESEVVRWRRAMPQYHVGHDDRIRVLEELLGQAPGLAVAGNAYHGVGIPQCIKSGWDAADQILANSASGHSKLG